MLTILWFCSAALPSVSPKKKIRYYSESPTQSDEDFLATSDSEGVSEGVSDGDSNSSGGYVYLILLLEMN